MARRMRLDLFFFFTLFHSFSMSTLIAILYSTVYVSAEMQSEIIIIKITECIVFMLFIDRPYSPYNGYSVDEATNNAKHTLTSA